MRIKGTKLHRSLRHVTSVDKRRVVRELAKAKRAMGAELNLLAGGIGGAFIWQDSPQGHTFWSAIDHEVCS